MALSFPDTQIHAKAVSLGLITEGQELPRHLRSRVVAALAAEQQRPDDPAAVPIAKSIVIRDDRIDIDGKPFPWLVARDRIELAINPNGASTVRLTLFAESVQVEKASAPESENRA